MSSRLLFVIALAITAPALPEEGEFMPGRDDPRGRIEARIRMEGVRSPEMQLTILQEAAREARRWRIGEAEAGPVAFAAAVPGKAWVNVGPAGGVQVSPITQARTDAGRIRKIVPHPTDPNILYLATAGGGVWKSFDAQAAIGNIAGPHWTSITSGVGSQSVGAFALDPNSPDTLYLGLGDPFDVQSPGFYTSADGGITWLGPVTLGNATSVRDIVVDPARTGVVLVATNDGLFRSTEGGIGNGWARIETGDCWSVAWVSAQTWLAACNGALWRSTDNGASFVSAMNGLTDVGRMTLAAAPSDSANPSSAAVYLLAASASASDQKDVFKSGNGGQSWASLDMQGTAACQPTCRQPIYWTNDQPDFDVMHDQAWYNQAIIVDPRNHDRFFIGGNLSMVRCDTGDNTHCYVLTDWLPGSPLGGASTLPYVHADWHAMAVSTTGSTAYFYAGTDGGLFRSSDAFTATPNGSAGTAATFEDRLNRGIATHLVYSLATDLHDASNPVMIGGLQDNGTRMRLASSPTTFNQVIGGDGFGVGIGITNSNAAPASCRGRWGSMLVGTIYTSIWSSTDCGATFSPLSGMKGICKSPSLLQSSPCSIDYGSNFFMRMASDQANAAGHTFVTFFNNSQCSPSVAQCTPAAGANYVYASQSDPVNWVNATGTIDLQTGATATVFPSQLLFVGTNPKAAGQWWVTTFSRAYITTNSGAAWKQSAVVPAGPVRGVAFEDATGNVLWAVTAGGTQHVFRSADGGATWVDKSANLPNVPANVVAVDPNASNTIYVGTEIGLYRSTDSGQSWTRYGTGLPLVSVTEINIALDSSAIRVSTFGRGFWELYPNSSAPTGVYGNGDFDHNQVIDAFDLVREAALLGETPADDDYDATGNLVGATNGIDSSDFTALVGKLGGRP